MNDKFIDEYDTEAVNKKLMNSLKSERYNNGKKQEKIEIAKNLNIPINTIIEATGLTKEELENLN